MGLDELDAVHLCPRGLHVALSPPGPLQASGRGGASLVESAGPSSAPLGDGLIGKMWWHSQVKPSARGRDVGKVLTGTSLVCRHVTAQRASLSSGDPSERPPECGSSSQCLNILPHPGSGLGVLVSEGLQGNAFFRFNGGYRAFSPVEYL